MSVVQKKDGRVTRIQALDHGFGGARKDILTYDGESGLLALEGKDLSKIINGSAFTGRIGVGVCTLASARAGDVVIGLVNLTAGTDLAASFEPVISVTGQIQQTAATNLSAANFLVMLLKRGL